MKAVRQECSSGSHSDCLKLGFKQKDTQSQTVSLQVVQYFSQFPALED